MTRRIHYLRGFARRAVTLIELLVVCAVASILLVMATGLYASSRKAGDIAGDVLKVQKLLATARSYAISSPDRYYQATFWPSRSLFWIDEIQVTVPADTVTTILRPKVVAPELVSDQVVLADARGGVAATLSDGSTVMQFRFYPDGSCDDGSVYLIRREAGRAGSNYQKIRIYGPTARTRLQKDQPAP